MITPARPDSPWKWKPLLPDRTMPVQSLAVANYWICYTVSAAGHGIQRTLSCQSGCIASIRGLRCELLGAGALNLSQYTGIWGGKWCNSSFDPPAPANAPAKPVCPVLPGYPVPSFTPINIPPISSLDNGTINVSDGNSTIPLELKVRQHAPSASQQARCRSASLTLAAVESSIDHG